MDSSAVSSAARSRDFGPKSWESFSRREGAVLHIDRVLGRYKAEEFLKLMSQWIPSPKGLRILKTDLSEEAFGEDHILFSPRLQESFLFALDIAHHTVVEAEKRQRQMQSRQVYLCGDVRNLPFINGSYDVILSTSTLDHFTTTDDFLASLRELRRVTKDGGGMIITVNNRLNLNYYFMTTVFKLLVKSRYPVQFYTPTRLRQLVEFCGWKVEGQEFIVHIMSPVNSILRMARKILPDAIVAKIAETVVVCARWLGERESISWLTGWFIALKCSARKS